MHYLLYQQFNERGWLRENIYGEIFEFARNYKKNIETRLLVEAIHIFLKDKIYCEYVYENYKKKISKEIFFQDYSEDDVAFYKIHNVLDECYPLFNAVITRETFNGM